MNNKVRGFEKVISPKNEVNVDINLPKRGTKGSAGYDMVSPISFALEPNESRLIWLDIKSYMQSDEVLEIYPRSSLGGKGLILKNTVGIIDSTYYGNKDNDGNIGVNLKNTGTNTITINQGDRIVQGIFKKFLTIDGDSDDLLNERIGGFGSTNKN